METEQRLQFPLFGDEIEIILYDANEKIISTLKDDIEEEALRLQHIFNFYDPASELSRLNQHRQLACSTHMLTVLMTAISWCERSKGLYDITKGRAFLLRKQGKELPELACSYRDIRISGNVVSLRHPDIIIDLGSIAKGYIVDQLLTYIQEIGIESVFINARGDMRISGKHLEVVAIQHPRKNESAGAFVMENMAVATSGDYQQNAGSYDRSHIIGGQMASVTVVANTLTEADVLATVLALVGMETAEQYLANASAYFIDKEGIIRNFGIKVEL